MPLLTPGTRATTTAHYGAQASGSWRDSTRPDGVSTRSDRFCTSFEGELAGD